MSKSIRLLCVISVLLQSVIGFTQIWVARYDGPGNGEDYGWDIAVSSAGNVHVTGESQGTSTGYTDYATVKYDASGVEQWVSRYNGPANSYDAATAIVVDYAGNVYVTGLSAGLDTYHDYATVKYDASGVEQWVARYDGPDHSYDEANAIAVDEIGSVYVTGRSFTSSTNWDYVTVKYNASGVEQWATRYDSPGSGYDDARAIVVDNTGNTYVTGWSLVSGTGWDYATVKYSALGVEQWVVRYNGPGNGHDRANAIAVDNAGNIYVTGHSESSGTGDDYATVKYDASGLQHWVAWYDGPAHSSDSAYAIVVDNVGNIYVTGWSPGLGTYWDYATVKYDSLGVEYWVARYDGPGNSDRAYAIAVDYSENVYVTGMSESYSGGSEYATVKYDSLGVEQWAARYNGPGCHRYQTKAITAWYDCLGDPIGDVATAIGLDNAGYIYVTGASLGSGTFYDYATIKYSPTGIEESQITQIKSNSLHATIFRGSLQLPEGKECRAFDITGRVVDPNRITRGIYFVEIDGKIVHKVIKVR
jgi:hypothetical protein